ncbi:transposase domain-containing protein [Martelella mediterranea]|uniref:Mu transposase-like protein n=1 Tax=Martelella mediterranea TaxID=293089 RepID=A0A4R3NKI3_9HYPH|nr:transposase domain-containing protein [Martelella mediterranea]TCT35405.1 Mu transposase-like protein [Martelella mediterranea]
MKQEWFTAAELAAAKLPGLPTSQFRVNERLSGARGTERARVRKEAGGGYEYHYSLLPNAARAKLAFMVTEPEARKSDASKLLWRRFEALSSEHKALCEKRLEVIQRVEAMVEAGLPKKKAVETATQYTCTGKSAYYEWWAMVKDHPKQDWLAALAPSFSSKANGVENEIATCHADAWAFLKSDYLRPEKPAFSACYRRMVKAARSEGWNPIPSERSLRRRLEHEVPKAVQVMSREGREKAKRMFPAQERSVAHLHAMEAVNADGHRLDLFVKVPWAEKPTRMYLIGTQDLYSRKVLSWRLAEAETWDAIRACFGDMVEDFGIPERIYLDNGRAFASKMISGGARTRYRYKIDADEVSGLLVTLGIEPRFVTPYHGQAKPIERAWGSLAEEISKHPAMTGCYTGNTIDAKPENYMQSACDLDKLQTHVAEIIAEHNARTGRRTETAKGKSFDQVFAESMAAPSTIVRQATEAQRTIWLLSAKGLKARQPDGSIHFMGSRYWSIELNQWIGKTLMVRFDPDNLNKPVKVYEPNGRYICDAEAVGAVRFDSQEEARRHARKRADWQKATKQKAKLEQQFAAEELAEILDKGSKASPPSKPEKVRPTVTRIATGNLAAKLEQLPEEQHDEDRYEDAFSRALERYADSEGVIQFPQGGKTKTG